MWFFLCQSHIGIFEKFILRCLSQLIDKWISIWTVSHITSISYWKVFWGILWLIFTGAWIIKINQSIFLKNLFLISLLAYYSAEQFWSKLCIFFYVHVYSFIYFVVRIFWYKGLHCMRYLIYSILSPLHTLISCVCVRYRCRWAGSIWYDPRSKLWYKSGYEVPERFRGKRTACELCLLCLYKPYAQVFNKTLTQWN